jgi:acetylornithine aminotransferase
MAAIKVIEKNELMKNASIRGNQIKSEVSLIEGVSEVRGEGLLLGIVLEQPIATKVVEYARSVGLLLNAPSKDVIRIAPALTLSEKEMREFLKKFAKSLALAMGAKE